MNSRRLIALTLVLAVVPSIGCKQKLNRKILDQSLHDGTSFLLANQTEAGDWNYQYDAVESKVVPGVSPVRQAGALWGTALLHHDAPSKELADSVHKGVEFFVRNSKLTEDGRRYVTYPGSAAGSTGTIALVCLAIVDFLRADYPLEAEDKAEYEARLSEFMKFLLSLRQPAGQFYSGYSHTDGSPQGGPSPYFDGESLLTMVKAAKYAGYEQLRDMALASADEMYRVNVTEALQDNPDSPTTKGFYQWSSMSFYEIYTSGWVKNDVWARRTIDLAIWMIDVHRTLQRRKNTAYAHEGMISAWECARLIGDADAQKKIGRVVDLGLYKLTTWQVAGPVPNHFLRVNPTKDPRAVGGIMNAKDNPVLRIDVTQHQMHAVILARRFIYTS